MTQTLDSRRFGDVTFHFDLMGLLGSGLADESLVIAASLFLIGTLVAFITPAAGFVQLAGLSVFYGKIVPGLGSDTNLGVGAIFGVVSMILVIYSLFNPVGVGIPQSKAVVENALAVACRGKTFRVNVLCIVGGGLAVIAIFLPWVSTTLLIEPDGLTYEYPATPIDYVSSQLNYEGVGRPEFAVAMSVLFGGVVLSFISPAGGFVQLVGVFMFYSNIDGYLVTSMPGYTFFRTELVYGFFLGVVAASITILSFFMALNQLTGKSLLRCDRILTWTLPGFRETDPDVDKTAP